MSCYGCAGNVCLYSCELESYYFTPGEIKNVEDICFCCDECKWFDGDWLGKRSQWREECPRFHEPIKRTEMKRFTAEKIARQKRALFQVIKGADK